MPRIRSIKHGFFTNDTLAECDPLARLLFVGLWVLADREGRLEDRPKKIKAELLPYDGCDPDALLAQLARFKFIERYQVNGTGYIQISNFLKHQKPHKMEAKSEIPPPLTHQEAQQAEQEEEFSDDLDQDENTENEPEECSPEISRHSAKELEAPGNLADQQRGEWLMENGELSLENGEVENGKAHSRKAANRARAPELSDEDWLLELQNNPAYQQLNVGVCHAKMVSWCAVNHKQPTRRRFINWLNREEPPMKTALRSVNGYKSGNGINAANSTEEEFYAEVQRIHESKNGVVIESEAIH